MYWNLEIDSIENRNGRICVQLSFNASSENGTGVADKDFAYARRLVALGRSGVEVLS